MDTESMNICIVNNINKGISMKMILFIVSNALTYVNKYSLIVKCQHMHNKIHNIFITLLCHINFLNDVYIYLVTVFVNRIVRVCVCSV